MANSLPSNIVKTNILLSDLKPGMTVEYDGQIKTVCKKDIKHCPFMGWSYLGNASKKQITLIQFAVPTAFGIVLR